MSTGRQCHPTYRSYAVYDGVECVISLTPLQEGPKFNFKSVKVGSLPRLPDLES